MKHYTPDELTKIKERDEAWLKTLEGVIGTGVGMDFQKGGEIALKVFVNHLTPQTQAAITNKYGNDVPVVIEAIGEVRKAQK